MEIKDILTFALDIGENMLKCNAEINRVEDTIIRICKSYGDYIVDIFAIKTIIIATIRDEDGNSFSENRRVYSCEFNMEKLEELNSLSRYICKNKVGKEEIKEKLKKFELHNFEGRGKKLVGGILGSIGFCIYFGGNFRDALAVGIIAVIYFYINKYGGRVVPNQVIATSILSFIIGALAIISVKIGIGVNVDKIIIGGVMLVIPGMEMVTGFRDMLSGDILAGTFRIVETLLITVGITLGFALALYWGGIV